MVIAPGQLDGVVAELATLGATTRPATADFEDVFLARTGEAA
jgi:hypothetical protein